MEEANLQATLDRATRAKTHSIEIEKRKQEGERVVVGAFIDGYEELMGNVSVAFSAFDFSSFVPYEAIGTDGDEENFDESESRNSE